MILSLIILLIGILALVKGYHRGLVNEFLKLIGLILALVLASNFADAVTNWLKWVFNPSIVKNSNQELWHAIGFIIVLMIALLVIHFITNFLNRIFSLPILHQVNSLLGAIASLVIWLVIITLIIEITLLFKVQWVMDAYQNSIVAQLLVNNFDQIFTF